MKRLAIILTVAVVLAACGSSTKSAVASVHNEQDVSFASAMKAHHQQAIAMAQLAEAQTSNADIKTLAAQIQSEQGAEITTMQNWLQTWGATDTDQHATMGHDMAGMSNADAINQLKTSNGADFDKMFLMGMIEHHRGAIDMAQVELSKGQSAKAKALAQSVVTSQQVEIDQMNSLLQASP